MFILSAETRQEGISKRRRQLSRVSSLERGDSCDSAHIESSTSYNSTVPKVEISGDVCDSTLHEDFARLLNDIRRFRSTLTDSEREEFDCKFFSWRGVYFVDCAYVCRCLGRRTDC